MCFLRVVRNCSRCVRVGLRRRSVRPQAQAVPGVRVGRLIVVAVRDPVPWFGTVAVSALAIRAVKAPRAETVAVGRIELALENRRVSVLKRSHRGHPHRSEVAYYRTLDFPHLSTLRGRRLE